jgi:putative endonuclease
MYRKRVGRWGEEIASEFLEKSGHIILERNFNTPYGEIDIITLFKEQIVFVEVKTRTNSSYGAPEGSITLQKRAHMIDAAAYFLQTHPELDDNWQIDVITVEGSLHSRTPKITHFQNAVS